MAQEVTNFVQVFFAFIDQGNGIGRPNSNPRQGCLHSSSY